MMVPAQPEVLVVGSGPTALILALGLVQNGVSIRVIEKVEQPSDAQRGNGSQPRSLEIYKFLGILDDVLAAGRSIPLVKQFDYEGNLLSVVPFTPDERKPTPDKPFTVGHVIGQERFCRVLREHLKKHSVEVEYSSELVALEQFADHASAKVKKGESLEVIDVPFVVGADGGKGAVRKLLGLKFLGETKSEVVWALGDIEVTEGQFDKEYMSVYGATPGDMMVIIPTLRALEENVFYTLLTGPNIDADRAVIDKEYFFGRIRQLSSNPQLQFGEAKSLYSYRPNNFRTVETFRKGRVFVAGDAAHIHSSTGGQGLNSGVMDAFNLAWKLSLVLKGISTPALLDSYTSERLPVIKDMLRITADLLQKTYDANRKGEVLDRPAFLQQLGVNYRGSGIVLDEFHGEEEKRAVASAYETDEVLRAGCRAPEAPKLVVVGTGKEITVFDIFKANLHTVLIFPSSADCGAAKETLEALADLPKATVQSTVILPKGFPPSQLGDAKVDIIVEDTEGHAFAAYDVPGADNKVVVVRPDGYIGALVHGSKGVAQYFSKVFDAV